MAFIEQLLVACFASPLRIACVVSASILTVYWISLRILQPVKVPEGLRLPPCPPGASVLSGHAHLWNGEPLSQPTHNQLISWSDELGEVYHLRMNGQLWFVFSSPQAVKDIFDKHGAITATRPRSVVADELLSGGNRLIFMPYRRKWRTIRSIVHQCLTTKATDTLKPSQDIESRKYLLDLLQDPKNFLDHAKRYATSVIIYATYGFRILTLDDPILQSIYRLTDVFGRMRTARYLVDRFPILSMLPQSFQWWRRQVDPYREEGDRLMLSLWNGLKKQVESGIRTGCFVERFIEVDYQKLEISEVQAAWAAGSMIEAGADTTQLTLNSLILGLVAFPEVVRQAHEELDRVVGERMPDFEDAASLPYVRAIVKEVLRWRSPVNDHIRHDTTEDIVYKGYFIPAGSAILINLWAIHWDETVYPEPERFNPSRFLDTKALDLTAGECINASDVANRDHFSFGAGRRVCPGYNLAENSLFLLTARLLWAFDVRSAVDPLTGQKVIYNTWAYEPKRLYGPRPFPVEFKVRNKRREEEIRKAA